MEDLKIKKSELVDIIDKEESEKLILEKSLRSLQEKLNNLNNNLLQHKNLCDSYDRAIRDTENGFKKVIKNTDFGCINIHLIYFTDIGKFSNIVKLSAA